MLTKHLRMGCNHPNLKIAGTATLLFAANVFVCGRLFVTDYLIHLGSVDGPFIAISRYVMKNYPDLSWWPLWFCGMPYRNVYGPVLQHLVAALAFALHRSPALTFHAVAATFYCLGPVTVFWMTCRFSGSWRCGYWAGLLYSVVSPVAILFPSVRAETQGMFYLRRLFNLVGYGEAAHVAVLALMPLLLISLDAALCKRRPAYYVLSAVALACLLLTNVTGSVGLALALLSYLLSLPRSRWRRSLLATGIIALLAYGLAIPWIPPSTVRLISSNSQWSLGNHFPFKAWHLLYFSLVMTGAALLCFIFERRSFSQYSRFALFLSFFSGAIALPAFWANIAVVPQPMRFQLEMEMGLCLALASAVSKLEWRFPTGLVAAVLMALCAAGLIHNHRHATELIRPVDIRTTTEYKAAMWFDQNMHGRRVFAPGSVSLWMNVFTDTPQLGGCCDQSVPNWEQRVALYTIYTGQNAGDRDGEICLLWLQAYGVHAVGVSGPSGREWFKPFWNPHKFDGLLPVLWRDGGDVIYGVPQRSGSLAHVIRKWQVVSRAPTDGLNVAPLRPYVDALNDPQLPLATMQWTAPGRAGITGDLRPNDLISVQVSYDAGWRAQVNGSDRHIESDALGMMVIDPQCTGACTVHISYTDTTEIRLARIIQMFTALGCFTALLAGRRERPTA